MPLFSLPDECFISILSFLDKESIYKCLFVNRYYCKLSIPTIWRDPFTESNDNSTSLINTLLSCLNEDEISSLIPCAIRLTIQPPLFEYGKFVRKIDHDYCIENVTTWLYLSNIKVFENQDCRVQKLTDAICHMIMRKGSNLQEFVMFSALYDLPKFSIFTNYNPGIINLNSLCIYDMKYHQNAIEFLSMVSEFCNCIINFELNASFFNDMFANQILDIIKSQPLKRIKLFDYNSINIKHDIKKTLYALEKFRSETLKELSFYNIYFQQIDLSSISKLECLEQLEFVRCRTGFTFKKKLYLKKLKLWYCIYDDNVKLHAISMINFLCSKTLLKLSLNIVTPETVKAVKETCPNISFLCIEFSGENSSLIPLICELSSLRTLNIKLNWTVNHESLIKLLSNHLIFVKHLFLDFYISSENFEYFVNNCKANLKSLNILINMYSSLRKNYLVHVTNFQKIHNSLNIFGIGYYKYKFNWTDEETEIVNLLKSQGIDIISIDDE